MKPTRRPHLPASRLASLSLTASLALAGCVPAPRQTPAPTPAPAPAPAPSPVVQAPPPPPFSGGWMDAPITPGDWIYSAGIARFGQPASEPLLTMRCDPATRTVEIWRPGSAVAALPMVVRTETMERSIDAIPAAGAQQSIVARLSARDPLLDAMAFSKGRFAIEVGGMQTLYVPSWQEVTRVIEDCR